MLSIAEWTDRALALYSPMKLTSSANFSPSIRISLRLKIHQAQAKNFCRVLDIRVTKIVIANTPLSLLISSDVNADGVINNEDAQAVIDQITGIYAA